MSTLALVLLIVLIVLIVGGLPTWPHSQEWGYGPSGALTIILIIVLLLMLFGRL